MSLFAELRRRNVIRVGVAYCVAAWVVAQVAEFAFSNFGSPDWVLKSLVVVLILGLPFALIFAWAFELTPDGIRRERDVAPDQSITSQTGRKLDRLIIVVLVAALGWFAWDKFLSAPEPQLDTAVSVEQEDESDSEVVQSPLAVTRDKSVAVLPFVAMSNGPDDEFFADGLTEEILNSLAQLPELLVTARTSAFSFKGQDVPVQDIAEALGVRHVVEGSVRRSGDRLRVTAQLIRADDAFHLWSENYDSTSTDTIAVQEDIAEKIAAALDVVLDEKKREAMRAAGLRDVKAFTLYQRGLEVYERAHGDMETIEGLTQANQYFEQVIERVPDFAMVYVDHSDLNVHKLADDAILEPDAEHLSEQQVREALAAVIDDYGAAERHARNPAMSAIAGFDLAYVSGNWRGIGGRLERAISESACYEGNWMSLTAYQFGYSDAYLELARRVVACDPRRSLSWFNLSRAALRAGRPEEALQAAREGVEIAPGGWLNVAYVRALVALGEYDAAQEIIDDRAQEPIAAAFMHAMIAAHRGDAANLQKYHDLVVQHDEGYMFWPLIVSAWGGQREEANRLAALIDKHPFRYAAFSQVLMWCACGAPFDLESTPNFAEKLKLAAVSWPPPEVMEYPLKDW